MKMPGAIRLRIYGGVTVKRPQLWGAFGGRIVVLICETGKYQVKKLDVVYLKFMLVKILYVVDVTFYTPKACQDFHNAYMCNKISG